MIRTNTPNGDVVLVMTDQEFEAEVLCENGHSTTVWATLIAQVTDRLTFIMGSSADFCDKCDGLVIETICVRVRNRKEGHVV